MSHSGRASVLHTSHHQTFAHPHPAPHQHQHHSHHAHYTHHSAAPQHAFSHSHAPHYHSAVSSFDGRRSKAQAEQPPVHHFSEESRESYSDELRGSKGRRLSASSSHAAQTHAQVQSALDIEKAREQAQAEAGREAVVSVLACILEQLFAPKPTDVLPEDPSQITMFHTERVPGISISAYLHRLSKYAECSSEVLVQSIIHINRILHHRPNFSINSLNIHRLLLTSLLCSAKFFDDTYFNNAYYAKVGGVPAKELNCLEVEFLALINFDLFVHYSVYQHFYQELSSPKLHTNCRCKHAEMPTLREEEFYHPVLMPEPEPVWNIAEMIELHSIAPSSSSAPAPSQSSASAVSSKPPLPSRQSSRDSINSQSKVQKTADNSSDLPSQHQDSAMIANLPSLSQVPISQPSQNSGKRVSPSVASTASNSGSNSGNCVNSANCSDEESSNAADEEEDDDEIVEPKAKQAKKADHEFAAPAPRTAAVPVPTRAISTDGKEARMSISMTASNYRELVNETRHAMDTLSIDSKGSPAAELLDRGLEKSDPNPPIDMLPHQFSAMSDSPPVSTRSIRQRRSGQMREISGSIHSATPVVEV